MPLGTILIVEDDQTLLALLEDALGGEGYRVVTATGLAAAAAVLRRELVDLVLTAAPRETTSEATTGLWAAVERLRALAQGAPVLLVTGHPRAHAAAGRARGVAGLLPLPFDLDTLFALVRDLLPGSAGR